MKLYLSVKVILINKSYLTVLYQWQPLHKRPHWISLCLMSTSDITMIDMSILSLEILLYYTITDIVSSVNVFIKTDTYKLDFL